MEIKKFAKARRDAYEAGQTDMYVEEKLLESAESYLDEVPDTLTDEQTEDLIHCYRDGFLGRELLAF